MYRRGSEISTFDICRRFPIYELKDRIYRRPCFYVGL